MDFLVSNYYYRYANRKSVTNKPNSPKDIFEYELPYLVKTYKLHDRLAKKPNVLRIAYEEMIKRPEDTFSKAVEWLGLPLDMDNLRTAITFSSFDTIRKHEEQYGHIVAANNFQGFFTRSGKIGDWKKYFSNADAQKVKAALEKEGVSLARFTFE